MNQELITQIQTALAPVAEKIGQGATFGWETVMRQQIAYGVADLFVSAVALVGFIASLKLWKLVKEDDDLYPLAIFASLFSVPIFLIFGIEGIFRLVNPNYYAIEFFMDLVQ